METKITATELGRNLSDVLNRVRYRGERFVIERNGETIATMEPVEAKSFTLRDLAALRARFPVDDQFADDLEAVIAERQMAEVPEWPN